MPTTTAHPRRRWFRFSLRTLFVLIVLLAIPCAGVAREIAIVRERNEVAELLSVRVGIALPLTLDSRPLAWWRQWLGDVSIDRVYYNPDEVGPDLIAAFPEATVEPLPE